MANRAMQVKGYSQMMAVFAGVLVTTLTAAAEVCEEGRCSVPPEQPTGEVRGISLFQSGRSVLPGIAMKASKFAFDDGLVDEFANLEDEFDDGAVEARTSTQPAPKAAASTEPVSFFNHASDPYLYVETLLVIALFACGTKIFTWVSSPSSQAALKKEETPQQAESSPAAVAVSEAKSAEAAPIFALGGSKDFAVLEQAVRAGDEARCEQILDQGGRWAVRQEDPCGCTALHVAAHCGSATMARLLLDRGAKVDACEAWDETPLHIAARSGSVEVCDLLLSRNASIDAVNANDWTPLLVAGHANQEAVCELLLSRGAGAGGMADTDLPPLVNALIFRRMFAGAVPRSPAESDVSAEEAREYFDD